MIVVSNAKLYRYIRSVLTHVCNKLNWTAVFPPVKYCTDNGVMIAWNGVERWRRGLGKESCLSL